MRISICICTYNQARYVEQAISSAARQTVSAFEIIVSDDCSTDDTPKILDTLLEKIPTLKVIRQKKNLGIAKNTDACLRLATGDFIVRLDSDDVLLPNFSEKLSALLLKFPLAGYAHADVQEIDQNGEFLKVRRLYRSSVFQTSDEALKAAAKGYRVAANIIMFRREALVKVNYLTGRPNFGEDYHLAASISAADFGNVHLKEVLCYYRVWVDIGMIRRKRKLDEIEGLRRVFEEVLEPAFRSRHLNTHTLEKNRIKLACSHADCLGWQLYSPVEKEQLVTELFKLSSAFKVRVFVWLYLNNLGSTLSLVKKSVTVPKAIFKSFLLRTRP